ncbi:MAG: saccharopine dehydrogenase [Bacteroidetes bacterium]|nr:saccharopine dehydrogenase [Bacteroidota bacterium]
MQSISYTITENHKFAQHIAHMKKILILGAGKSSIYLIDYLVEHAAAENWEITVGDISAELAFVKTKGRTHTTAVTFDIKDEAARKATISAHDVVISMLPATLHTTIAEDCLELGKNLVTPSYISPAMKAMNEAVTAKGLIFMNEMGLDPGIDHMSAMQIIDHLQSQGKKILSFRSHCGGLVAPESDDNAWHYKFSWNPRNVILAGQGDGGIKWKEDGAVQEIHYHQLFSHVSTIDLQEDGIYDSYPNRDSLKYISEYHLDDIETMYRGTLRMPPFCEAWDCLVQLGLTAPTGKCNFTTKEDAIEQLALQERPEIQYMLEEIGTFDERNFPHDVHPADSLQKLLETKWKMRPEDKDLVVMVHEIEYQDGEDVKRIQSSLYIKGTNGEHTAMALTVGLPLAIVTKLILKDQISLKGVLMPKHKEIYEPVMKELEEYGVKFKEVES